MLLSSERDSADCSRPEATDAQSESVCLKVASSVATRVDLDAVVKGVSDATKEARVPILVVEISMDGDLQVYRN